MERIGHEVERRLRSAGDGSALALAEITAAWPRVVGADIAKRAWPLRLARDGTLHVATESATWAFELDRLSTEIHARLAAVLRESAPRTLRFRVGPVPESGRSKGSHATPEPRPPPSPEAASEAASAASAIDDPELREIVERAARASLSKGRSDRSF